MTEISILEANKVGLAVRAMETNVGKLRLENAHKIAGEFAGTGDAVVLFLEYNSNKVKKNKEWYGRFLEQIDQQVIMYSKDNTYSSSSYLRLFAANCLENLAKLRKHVELELAEQTTNFNIEWFERLNNLRQVAEKENKLSKVESEYICTLMGRGPNRLNAQPIHVKLVLLGLMNELLHMKHKAATPRI